MIQLEIRPSHLREIVLHPSYIALEVKAQRVQVQRFDLDTSIAHTTVYGMFDLTGSVDMQYALTANLAEWQPLLGMTALAGDVQTQGQVSGTWPALNGRGTIEGRHLHYQDHAVDSLHLTYDGSQLGSQPQLTAQLQVRHARVGTLPVEQVALDVTSTGAEGQVQFAAEVVQSAKSGGRARGTLTRTAVGQQVVLEEFEIQLPDRTWHAAAPLQVAFGPQRLDLGQIHLVHDDESIELSGAVQDEELQDIQLHAIRVDLSYLRQLFHLPEVIGGRATFQAHLTGTRTEPRFESELTLQPEASQRLPFTQFHNTLAYAQRQLQSTGRLHRGTREIVALDVRLPIDLTLDRVTIERLQLASRSGPLQVTGWFEHTNLALRQIDLALSARNFTAMHTSAVEAAVSADITVRGTLQAVTATGSVTVPSARLRLEHIPGSGPKRVQPWELTIAGVYGPGPKALGTGKGPATVPTWSDLSLPFVRADIQIDIPRNVWLQGPSTAIEAQWQYARDQRPLRPFYP